MIFNFNFFSVENPIFFNKICPFYTHKRDIEIYYFNIILNKIFDQEKKMFEQNMEKT